jgi:hypothetical protein
VKRAAVLLAIGLVLVGPSPAHADIGRGIQYLFAGLVELPRSTLIGTVSGFPVLGTVFGVLGGAVRSVGLVSRGALEVLGGVVPFVGRLAPLIPVVL